MNRCQSQNRPAAVLILAMLLMSAIIGSSIALSIVISDSGRQTSTLNNFIAASLAADSGLERGLAVVKAGRVNQGKDETKTAAAIDLSLSPNNFVVTADSPATNKLTWTRLLPRESVTFDLFKVLADDALDTKMGITGTSTSGTLDVSWVGLSANKEPLFTGRKFLSNTELNTTGLYDLISTGYNLYRISGEKIAPGNPEIVLTAGFRIRLTAQPASGTIADQTINNLTVTGANGFPSRITISSKGAVNNSQAIKTASVAWQLPTSSVFNYVVFTEGSIIPE